MVEWCGGKIVPGREHPFSTSPFILVGKDTRVPAFIGDWIIRNSVKEFYPIPALLYQQAYVIVGDENNVQVL